MNISNVAKKVERKKKDFDCNENTRNSADAMLAIYCVFGEYADTKCVSMWKLFGNRHIEP